MILPSAHTHTHVAVVVVAVVVVVVAVVVGGGGGDTTHVATANKKIRPVSINLQSFTVKQPLSTTTVS